MEDLEGVNAPLGLDKPYHQRCYHRTKDAGTLVVQLSSVLGGWTSVAGRSSSQIARSLMHSPARAAPYTYRSSGGWDPEVTAAGIQLDGEGLRRSADSNINPVLEAALAVEEREVQRPGREWFGITASRALLGKI